MSKAEVGSRVGAIRNTDEQNVYMFGWGTYQGEEVPPPSVLGPFGPLSIKNPKILLDSGQVVWGCECWWGPEQSVKRNIGKREVVFVDIEAYRAEAQQDNAPASPESEEG